MIYVISKSTFGDYEVRDIQCNANWCSCPYSDYALIPDELIEGILATRGYCDITLNDDETEVVSFVAREIPPVREECCGDNTVLSVNGVKADIAGEVALTVTRTVTLVAANWVNNAQTVAVEEVTADNDVDVGPAPVNHVPYCEAGVYCSEQAAGSLTFTCSDVPAENLAVNVRIWSKGVTE